jgi:hypothetical protein
MFTREILGFLGFFSHPSSNFPGKSRFFWPICYRADFQLMTTIPSNRGIGKPRIGRMGYTRHRFLMLAHISHIASFYKKTLIERLTKM